MKKNKLIKLIPYILIIIGLGAIGLAFVADLVGLGGQGGFGAKQKLLVLVGSLLGLFGLSLILPASQKIYNRLLHPTESDKYVISMSSVREKATVIFLVAVWFGFTTGYAETLFRLIRKYIFGDILSMSKQFVWMITVADLLLFGVAGLLLFLIALFLKKAASIGFIAFIFGFIMILSLYYVKPKIALYAVLLLAAGIAFQLARFLSIRQSGFYKVVCKSLPWMAVLLALVSVLMLTLG